MPNRVLWEEICTDERMNALSFFEEALFTRLLVYADDYGRAEANPRLIKGHLFPLRDDVSLGQIEAGLGALSRLGLIVCYRVGERAYLQISDWAAHQRIRAKESRFPTMEEGEEDGVDMPRNEEADYEAGVGDTLPSCAEQSAMNEARVWADMPWNDETEYEVSGSGAATRFDESAIENPARMAEGEPRIIGQSRLPAACRHPPANDIRLPAYAPVLVFVLVTRIRIRTRSRTRTRSEIRIRAGPNLPSGGDSHAIGATYG